MNRERIEELGRQFLFDALPSNGPAFDFDSVSGYMIDFAFAVCRDLIDAVDRLEHEKAELERLRKAMVKQNAQQEQEIEELEAKVCGMREALREVAEDDDPRDGCAHADRAKQALSSAPPACPHKEEAERLREEMVTGEAGGRLLQAVQQKTEAEVVALQAALDEANGRVMEVEFYDEHRMCNYNVNAYELRNVCRQPERHAWPRERWTEEAKAVREKG